LDFSRGELQKKIKHEKKWNDVQRTKTLKKGTKFLIHSFVLESPHFTFNEHIFLIFFIKLIIFIILDAPILNYYYYYIFLNVEGNGAMCKEFKLKNTN
jgi:hypothetical protein